jgi:hypothetical protein
MPDLDAPGSLEMIWTLENFRSGPGGGEYRLGYFCERRYDVLRIQK